MSLSSLPLIPIRSLHSVISGPIPPELPIPTVPLRATAESRQRLIFCRRSVSACCPPSPASAFTATEHPTQYRALEKIQVLLSETRLRAIHAALGSPSIAWGRRHRRRNARAIRAARIWARSTALEAPRKCRGNYRAPQGCNRVGKSRVQRHDNRPPRIPGWSGNPEFPGACSTATVSSTVRDKHRQYDREYCEPLSEGQLHVYFYKVTNGVWKYVGSAYPSSYVVK